MTDKTETQYIRDKNIHSCTLGDEVIILDSKSELYLGLNPTAAYIWKALAEPFSPTTLTEKLIQTFDVPYDIAYTHVSEILELLLQKSLIVTHCEMVNSSREIHTL